jgi:hypothetical protein
MINTYCKHSIPNYDYSSLEENLNLDFYVNTVFSNPSRYEFMEPSDKQITKENIYFILVGMKKKDQPNCGS